MDVFFVCSNECRTKEKKVPIKSFSMIDVSEKQMASGRIGNLIEYSISLVNREIRYRQNGFKKNDSRREFFFIEFNPSDWIMYDERF